MMYKMTEKKEFKSLEYSPICIKYRGNTKNLVISMVVVLHFSGAFETSSS